MNRILHHCLIVAATAALAPEVAGAEIWNGPSISFSKAAFADPAAAASQDRITDDVWITRGNVRGLYSAASESAQGQSSPAGTMWAIGTTADLESLTFDTWLNTVAPNPPLDGPPNYVEVDLVVHLVADDVFFDLRFTDWGVANGGGGSFAYVRSTPSVDTGDFNGDGLIDAADYTVWRDTVGSTSDLRADGNGDLVVNDSDYDLWAATFGDAAPAASAALPEPLSVGLSILGLVAVSTTGTRWD